MFRDGEWREPDRAFYPLGPGIEAGSWSGKVEVQAFEDGIGGTVEEYWEQGAEIER